VPLPLVYVHGAGPQLPMKDFKTEADGLIFGKAMASTRVGYYADVRWPQGPAGATPVAGRRTAASGGRPAAAGAAGANRRRRTTAIRAAMAPELSADAAAARVVAATLQAPSVPRRGTAAGPAAGAGGASAPDIDAATALVEELFREADRIANRSPRARRSGTALNITFPDPIFRFVVGKFASDVLDYLYGPFKAAMRDPVRKALLASPSPKVIVAHSLGTIITYDVLNEPDLAGLKVDILFTLGCPLGIGNVQRLLRDSAGKPNPVPPQIAAWSNYSDPFDPVALEHTLRDEFSPPPNFAHDEEVNNQARNNHDLTGYLRIPLIAQAIAAAVG